MQKRRDNTPAIREQPPPPAAAPPCVHRPGITIGRREPRTQKTAINSPRTAGPADPGSRKQSAPPAVPARSLTYTP